MTTALNAADEEAVAAFVRGEISFPGIFTIVEDVLDRWDNQEVRSLDDVWAADRLARESAREAIRRTGK